MKRLLREAGLRCGKAVVALGLATCVLLSAHVASADSLSGNRDRLFEDYVTRLAPWADAYTKCRVWRTLSLEQQGAFYTITHRLSISHLRDGASLLDHITHLYSIRGDTDSRACHGADDNRLFMSMDNALRSAFTTLYLYPGGATYCDIYENRNGYLSWRDSGDWAGPHEPFTDSRETVGGYPTAQVHFFADYRATDGRVCRTGLSILGGCVTDPNMVEMDQDYDWNHPSSTECVYDNPLQGRDQRGRDMYDSNWGVWRGYGPLDTGWEPSACSAPPPPPPPSGPYIGCFTDDGNRALPQWLGSVGDVDACVNLARANGLAYAGLQWYGECFGGNQLGYTQVADSECNTPCSSGQMCGGAWRNSIYATGTTPPPPPPPGGSMQADSAVRGCSNWNWWSPVYQPDPGSCYTYCAQNGANACEWYGNGDCYVEFGSGCYVQGGFPGWWAAVF
ncbi:MAG TPA: WSC domain-containing protein [Thermoanaerobaculia bacterium]|nr:WSC domain-containing protein [Thermoanaerobaculia bacterium]